MFLFHLVFVLLISNFKESNELIIGNITFNTFDLGGHVQTRRLWNDYFPELDALVFMIDVSESDRFQEAKTELDGLLSVEKLKHVLFLVLGNKIDKEGAVSEDVLRQEMGLIYTTGKVTLLTKTTLSAYKLTKEAFSLLRSLEMIDTFVLLKCLCVLL